MDDLNSKSPMTYDEFMAVFAQEREQAETQVTGLAKLTSMFYGELLNGGVSKRAARSLANTWLQGVMMQNMPPQGGMNISFGEMSMPDDDDYSEET